MADQSLARKWMGSLSDILSPSVFSLNEDWWVTFVERGEIWEEDNLRGENKSPDLAKLHLILTPMERSGWQL